MLGAQDSTQIKDSQAFVAACQLLGGSADDSQPAQDRLSALLTAANGALEETGGSVNDPYMAGLVRRMEAFCEKPLWLHAQAQKVHFRFNESKCWQASERIEHIIRDVNPDIFANLCPDLRQEYQDDSQGATEAYFGRFQPGMCVWQFDRMKKFQVMTKPDDKAPKGFVLADFLAVIIQAHDLYRRAMQNLKRDTPKSLHDWHFPAATTLDLRHFYFYLGGLGTNNWSKTNSPGEFRPGKTCGFYADCDAYWYYQTDEDKELLAKTHMPEVSHNVIDLAIQALVNTGLPGALKKLEWTEAQIQEAMHNCGIFTSNCGTDPDRFKENQKLSFHMHFLWKGPYMHEPEHKTHKKCCNPKNFERFFQMIIQALAEFMLDERNAADETKLFGACLAAACMDQAVYTVRRAMKVNGCTKGKLYSKRTPEQEQIENRWQHLNVNRNSGKNVLALNKIAFGEGVPESEQMIAGVLQSCLANSAIVSPHWMQHVNPVHLGMDAECRKNTERSINDFFKPTAHAALMANLTEPTLTLSPKQRAELKEIVASLQGTELPYPKVTPKRKPPGKTHVTQCKRVRFDDKLEALDTNEPMVFGHIPVHEFSEWIDHAMLNDPLRAYIDSMHNEFARPPEVSTQ